ncbi:nuclear RNA export factor 1-like [Tropilaelaps mercedesae]|uniref:Nuclear RNA export factor 1-like n=1 Tax=Tropilaelaps mercedesae TaxID=418985 RepID=A0A1V9XIF8_9ACAR|nr:nuclear RNA export factor 1-like [Tropilaelaps mercedesae]
MNSPSNAPADKKEKKNTRKRERGLLLCYLNTHITYYNESSIHPLTCSAVRERFPRVVILDQKQLPPPIVFDLEEEKIAVPRSLPSHLPMDQTRQLVVGFVEQFFACFDSDDRSPLIDAYHEAAVFSLSATTLCNSKSGKDREKLDYKGDCRNFLRMQHDDDLKRRLLRQGRINILDYLKNFAKTQHDPSSFVVDVSFIQPTLMLFHVGGVFRERRPDGRFLPNLRSFQRSFAVVPQGVGLAIVNDEWFITVATDKQNRAYQEPSPPSRPPSPAAASMSTPAGSSYNDEIVAKFMEVTKMNRRFSIDCLVQHNWNPEAAFEVFRLLEQNGRLPPEAFQKI